MFVGKQIATDQCLKAFENYLDPMRSEQELQDAELQDTLHARPRAASATNTFCISASQVVCRTVELIWTNAGSGVSC